LPRQRRDPVCGLTATDPFADIGGRCFGTQPRAVRFFNMANKAHDTPAEVDAEHGDVKVIGPGGIAYSFTPDAAAETSDRLLHGAAKANGQAINERQRRAEREIFKD
jgi:hypothetical protein